ncbi:uncharacterized protein BDCG_04059 [Blastomyces dermatitidis ER-3]|nr:uncharacterized protein BDCG_04059 [Blastomyces dermatitidis ER-3]EEQ88939.2 hypothetical protein BDCG_04059 [Blastomyces dermatitidis ER-3]EGE82346.2 hypothetical protein BDDG_05290 [Blastomyces dermatitidis ATCC 18188]EQL32758.1 hypothetical protein BDFG_05145 [Blastomyces dermatitidis ATCC 26199]
MYAISKFIQTVQIFSLRTNAILEYFRNALLLSCMIVLFVEGIARRNTRPRMPDRIPIPRTGAQMYREVLGTHARYEIDILPPIPEEEGEE